MPAFNASDLEVTKTIGDVAIVELPEDENANSVVAALISDPAIETAQPDYLIESMANEIQWGIQNTGQMVNGRRGVSGVDIGLSDVTATAELSPVTVAVLDTGVDVNHESLKAKCLPLYSTIGGSPTDTYDFFHGTQIASIIAAESSQMIGAASNATIMPLRFMSNGSGYISDALTAIAYAKQRNVKILNCSWGGSEYSPVLKAVLEENSNMLFICAAGNGGITQPIYPAGYDLPNVISVASMDNQGNLARSSNYGVKVDIAAPGVDIYTSIPNQSYALSSGTSMATAFVTAAAALYLGADTNISPADLKSLILSSAKPLSTLTGKVKTGGHLDVTKLFALGGVNSQPDDEPTEPINDDGTGFMYGDINGDNTVNIADSVLLAQYLAGWDVSLSARQLLGADTNADGTIDIRDAILLLQYLAGWSHVKLGYPDSQAAA
jgi:subtilisin family serine protease